MLYINYSSIKKSASKKVKYRVGGNKCKNSGRARAGAGEQRGEKWGYPSQCKQYQ